MSIALSSATIGFYLSNRVGEIGISSTIVLTSSAWFAASLAFRTLIRRN
jgi:hypothetical protein